MWKVWFWTAAAALVFLLVLVWYERPWEPHISAGAAERELRAVYVRNAHSVDCHRARNDGSIAMDDVDYACVVDVGEGEAAMWWVGSDWDHITEADFGG